MFSAAKIAKRYLQRQANGKKTGYRDSVGLFIPLPAALARQFPSLGTEDRSPPHTTFLFVGDVSEDREADFLRVLSDAFQGEGWPRVKATLGDLNYFQHTDKGRIVPHVAVKFGQPMAELRDRVKNRLEEAGFEVKDSFPVYMPHVTLDYTPGFDKPYKGDVPTGTWEFDEMEVWGLPKVHKVKFGSALQSKLGAQKRSPRDIPTKAQLDFDGTFSHWQKSAFVAESGWDAADNHRFVLWPDNRDEETFLNGPVRSLFEDSGYFTGRVWSDTQKEQGRPLGVEVHGEIAKRVARQYLARVQPLDLRQIEKFRKDFLMLMKNAKVVKDYKQALKWKEAVQTWSDRFELFVLDRLRKAIKDLRFQRRITQGDADYWDKKIGHEVWDLHLDFRVPLERYEFVVKYDPRASREGLFAQLQRELPKWEGRVRRSARKAWRVLKDFAEWYSRISETPLGVDIPEEERVSIEGLPVTIRGFPTDSSEMYADFLERFKVGLKRYKQRARQALPLLLRGQLPLVVDFRARLDEAGVYEHDHISINPTSAERNPGALAKTIAHEMGHHVYKTYLSKTAQDFWSRAISGNYGTLDLNEVARRYGGDKFLYDNERIKKENPLLYLQIQGLWHMPETKRVFDYVLGMDDLKKYLAEGGTAKFRVHGKPITGYAHKNKEEAFCEALGMLVGYGPRTVLPEVRLWLKTILPQIKIARHSVSQCMHKGCKKAPEIECIWAEGIGHAWFCKPHFKEWSTKGDGKGEVCRQWEIDGKAGEKKCAGDGECFYPGQSVKIGPYTDGSWKDGVVLKLERYDILNPDVLVRDDEGIEDWEDQDSLVPLEGPDARADPSLKTAKPSDRWLALNPDVLYRAEEEDEEVTAEDLVAEAARLLGVAKAGPVVDSTEWNEDVASFLKIAPPVMRVAFQYRLKTAGWWAIQPGKPGINPPPVDKGGLMNAIPGTDPNEGALYGGDRPADILGDAMRDVDREYLLAWGRPATRTELEEAWNFVMGPILEGGSFNYGSKSEPLNQWLIEFAEWLGKKPNEIMFWSDDLWHALARLWKEGKGPAHLEAYRKELLGVCEDSKGFGEHATLRSEDLAERLQARVSVIHDETFRGEDTLEGDQEPEIFIGRVASQHLALSAHRRSIALMKFLSETARSLGVAKHVYVVGGAVRNFVIERPIKDLDLVIDSMSAGRDSEWFAKELARRIPAATNLKTNQYGVAILTVSGDWELDGDNMKGEVIEIANARSESYAKGEGKGYKPSEVQPATIEQDIRRRDFTMNTLMWRLLDLAKGPDKAEIIDLTGCGLKDLKERSVKCPADPNKTFSDDPTRMLRVIKFTGKYGFKIPPDVAASIKRNARKMKQMPWEAIGNILVGDILKEPTARKSLRQMKELGLLDVVSEMIQEKRPFATFMANQLKRDRRVQLLLDLMDLGLPANTPLHFLTPKQRQWLRETTVRMPEDEASKFADRLIKPPVDNKRVIDELMLPPPERSRIKPLARELILADPKLADDPRKLTDLVVKKWK